MTMIHLHHEKGKYPQRVSALFDLDGLDLFFAEDVHSLLYGEAWESVLIEDGTNAFVHAFARSPISSTGLYDIEPLLGYSGPLANTTDGEFLRAALTEYSLFCSRSGIVAELIRFNPMLRNHSPLTSLIPGLRVVEHKPIAYIRLSADPNAILQSYARNCRRCTRKGLRLFENRVVDKSSELWQVFVNLYLHAMRVKKANPAWMFDSAFFERLRTSRRTHLIGTFREEEVLSIHTILAGEKTSYALLGANGNATLPHEPGASNANLHFGALHMAAQGSSWLCLGGGNSNDPQDPLMRFKASLASEVKPLPLGFFTHDETLMADLCAHADAEDPSITSCLLFLRYRLAPSFSVGRMKPGNWQDSQMLERPCPAESNYAV
jgi:hypothetical protein